MKNKIMILAFAMLFISIAVHAEEAKAKSVIQIWLGGGPAHTDTFDPKPNSGAAYTGSIKKSIPTNVDGIKISETLPLLAKQADKYSLLRGMTHGQNGHETATYIMQTCTFPSGDIVYPSVGAVIGQLYDYDGVLPPYILLPRSLGRFSTSGFLGTKGKPFIINGKMRNGKYVVSEYVDLESTKGKKLSARLNLLSKLDTIDTCKEYDNWDGNRAKAEQMLVGVESKTLDLSDIPQELRDKYGNNEFGQSCLLARKLVEKGVPFVSVVSPSWDTHKKHFEQMEKKLPILDQGLAALLEDLDDQGLLDTTIVLCGGEFGRNPKVSVPAPWNGGRQHYGKAFTWLIAGGGFRQGQVVGATDAKGENVVKRKIYPVDLSSSIYINMGIDTNSFLINTLGQKVPIIQVLPEGKTSEGVLNEIM
jgi:hypothetical protein